MSIALYRRRARVQVGPVVTDGLRTTFRVERTLRRTPNSVEVKVYNLSDVSRRAIEESRRRADTGATDGLGHPIKRVFVSLEAGYESGVHRIFHGDVRRLRSYVEAPDILTEVNGGDGEVASFTARVSRSYGRGTPVSVVLTHLAEAMGVGIGNAVEAFRGVRLRDMSIFHDGTVISGPAAHELDMLCVGAGLEWSIQDDSLQVLPIDGALGAAAIELTPNSGLIGAPSRDPITRIVQGKCLITPDVRPGRRVRVKSRFIDEVIRVSRTTTSGDTHGQDWYIEFEGRRPRTRDIFGNPLYGTV